MSYEMEELGRRASVVVREPSNEDDGYNEDDEYDEYELDNLDQNRWKNGIEMPGRVIIKDGNGRQRSKTGSSSHRIDYNNYGKQRGEDEDLDDDSDEEEEEDFEEDYDNYNEGTSKFPDYRVLPRTLPQIDIFTQRNEDNNVNGGNGKNNDPSQQFRPRNYSQVSAFILKNPFSKMGDSLSGHSKGSSLCGNYIPPKFPNSSVPRRSDGPSHGTSMGTSIDNESHFMQNRNRFNRNPFSDNTNTNNTNKNNNHNDIIPKNVHRLVARPLVDKQDKLLAEMSMLNEVKRKATEVPIYDSFPDDIEDKLRELRQSHVKIIQLLREREAKLEEQKRRAIQATNNALTVVNSNATNINSTSDNDTNDKITTSQSDTRNATILASTSASITTSGNQLSNMFREMPAPGLMSNPETSKYIDTLVNAIKDL